MDLHAHLKGGLTLEQALALSRRTGMFLGVAANCGKGFPIETDADAVRFVESMKGQPVFVGMQAEGREWVSMFSKETRARFDYVFTDGMTWTNPAGKRMRLWIPEEVEIGPGTSGGPTGEEAREQGFMDLLVSKIVDILETEPIDIYVNPTFLPAAIAAKYDALWTEERMTTGDRRGGEEGGGHRDQRPVQDPERGFPPPRQGQGGEVHLRNQQRGGQRPWRLVVPARNAEEARPQMARHVRPRPPAEPSAERVAKSAQNHENASTVPVVHWSRGGDDVPNMTITADEEVLRWARVRAAEENTSVARLVGDLLKERMQTERGYKAAKQRFLGGKAQVLSSEPYPSRDELHDPSGLR